MMAAKIVAAIVTCVLNLAIGVVVFSILVISLNGFTAESGQAALITYIVLAVAVTIAMSLSAFLLTGYLIKREFSGVLSSCCGTSTGSPYTSDEDEKKTLFTPVFLAHSNTLYMPFISFSTRDGYIKVRCTPTTAA